MESDATENKMAKKNATDNDEFFHHLRQYVEEREAIDELRQARSKLNEEKEKLTMKILNLEKEHKSKNESRNRNGWFRYYVDKIRLWKHEDKTWKLPSTIEDFEEEIERQQTLLHQEAESHKKDKQRWQEIKDERARREASDIKKARKAQIADIWSRKRKPTLNNG